MNAPQIRIGIIGAGWWASSVLLPALGADPRVALSAVSRLGRAELERVREQFNIPLSFLDYREMLVATKLDGVVVASPHDLHYEHARAALERRAHVFVEKPMTTSGAEARALVQLAAQQSREIMVAYGWNFTVFATEARKLVAAGRVGEIRHVSLHMASALADLFAGDGLAEAERALFSPARSTWADPRRSGGYAWGQLTHALGLLFRIADLEPAEVFALTCPSPAGVDAYDAAVVRFRNGATATLSGAASVPKHLGFQIDIRIFGSEGMLLLDIERQRLEVRRHDQADTIVQLVPGAGAYPSASPIQAFVDMCCGVKGENPAPGVVGQRSTEVLEALYRSASTQQFASIGS